MTVKTRAAQVLLGAAAVAGLLFAGTSGANALSYSPGPAVDGASLSVTSTSTSIPAGTYRVGICTKTNVGFPAIAPACGAFSGDVVLSSAGQIVGAATGIVKKTANANAHASIPGQPSTFNCTTNNCEVVIVNHSTRAFVERQDLAF